MFGAQQSGQVGSRIERQGEVEVCCKSHDLEGDMIFKWSGIRVLAGFSFPFKYRFFFKV